MEQLAIYISNSLFNILLYSVARSIYLETSGVDNTPQTTVTIILFSFFFVFYTCSHIYLFLKYNLSKNEEEEEEEQEEESRKYSLKDPIMIGLIVLEIIILEYFIYPQLVVV